MRSRWQRVTSAVLIIALAFTTITYAYADPGSGAAAGGVSQGAVTGDENTSDPAGETEKDGESVTKPAEESKPQDNAPAPEEPGGGGKGKGGKGGDNGSGR